MSALAFCMELSLAPLPALAADTLPTGQNDKVLSAHRVPTTALGRRFLLRLGGGDPSLVGAFSRALALSAPPYRATEPHHSVLVGQWMPVLAHLRLLLTVVSQNVLLWSQWTQVVGSHAQRHSAGVVNLVPIGDRADKVLVRPAVDSRFSPIDHEGAVASVSVGAGPQPAGVRLVHAGPEPLFRGEVIAAMKGFHVRSIHA